MHSMQVRKEINENWVRGHTHGTWEWTKLGWGAIGPREPWASKRRLGLAY